MVTHDILDLVAVTGLLALAALALVARRRIFRATDRIKIRAAAWSLLSDSAPNKDRSVGSQIITPGAQREEKKNRGSFPTHNQNL
jgi:hypothetical protein